MENPDYAYFQLCGGNDCLPRGVKKLKTHFLSLNFSARTVGTAAHVDISRKLDQSGGHTLKLTEDR